ncbi:variant erythrocyte surface antigen-1 alpha subunit [Babesia bovis T2Bo]|uniref:Variant erythrocyte surface antigen-1, alpha subunit n=1 Tax=Babesia bovis TaxID=5865 RepID=A7AWP5_BABBO|nr:variant erythrocyte surface antigen-1 alpha subunit [Babesia bovis T2Bo]EDO05473.1 variant erythrocyte surface antigen-1 alpha subunit [Babesia bovis T2Bo]|eukprot:XP_001609041.1 variant erythrocyte surface antigen-1, alpha subunit [Babesia bovis T2Bo]
MVIVPDSVLYTGAPSAMEITIVQNSVQLEYHGYQGDTKETDASKGASEQQVKEHLNGLFSLVQGLGGTAVVRTYIDQLAQVLSALVGWSRIEKCTGNGGCNGTSGTSGDSNPHGQSGGSGKCEYLDDVEQSNKCADCECMKWKVPDAGDHTKGHHLGRGCTKCKGSGTEEDAKKQCQCSTGGGGGGCQGGPGKECECAKEGKCCKCCCTGCTGKCNEKAKCSCVKEEEIICRDNYSAKRYISAYVGSLRSWVDGGGLYEHKPKWNELITTGGTTSGTEIKDGLTPSQRRHQCAQTLLGSVCLIWSGITYMYWTGKYEKTSPRWNNHILDGSGLDDGTLSQWLQALGFPREMLNNHGPGNRLDAIIWDGLSDKLLLGFAVPSGLIGSGVANDYNGNTARNPFAMNYAGFVHTAHRDSFNEQAIVFNNGEGSSTSDIDQHKRGALFKLYILSCAYFTGLQKRNSESTTRTPKTIREILYWLSALPYSQAYKEMLEYSKGRLTVVLKTPNEATSTNEQPQLMFYQDKRPHPITVDEYNLFAHFQAVTQYCPLVLIGIQGGLKSTDKTLEPAIHSLYANTTCHFTYPAVDIQAYNQVVHYIRALFYQLYFLRKQCAVKVTCGGKWRECRYGNGVLGKDVVSWMCLGCDPMEHDRNYRVENMKKILDELVEKVKALEGEKDDEEEEGIAEKVKALLEKIGEVVVQLGNAQEALEGKDKGAIEGVKRELEKAKEELVEAVKQVKDAVENCGLEEAKNKLEELTGNGGLDKANSGEYDPGKNKISAAIDGVCKALEALKKEMEKQLKEVLEKEQSDMDDITKWFIREKTFYKAVKELISICNSPKCSACESHSTKCGKPPTPSFCQTCLQPTTTGVPSPLQAFLEDRLPGFSCEVVRNTDTDQPYPPAASHLGHCNGSGQCCPLPMGFRGHFHGGIRDCTGQRLYGLLYFFSNENMMQSCVYTLVRVTAALSATTPQVLGDVFGFFRGGIGEKESGKTKNGQTNKACEHTKDPSTKGADDYFCGWCASGLRDEVKKIEWIPKGDDSVKGGKYRGSVGTALIEIKGDKGSVSAPQSTNTSLSRLTKNCQYLSPLTGELYTAVSATFGGTYLSWVLYLSDALQGGLESLSEAFQQIECRGCKGNCDPNKCRKGSHGSTAEGSKGTALCTCQSIVSCTGVLPVLYRHGFSYGNPFNLEGYQQKDGKTEGDYSIQKKDDKKQCHQFLESLSAVIKNKQDQATSQEHPLTELLTQVGQLQYDIRLPWIFVLTLAWLVAVLYLAFGAIWPLDWTHMRSHWLRGGAHQWQCMWDKVMTGRKGMELVEYFGKT